MVWNLLVLEGKIIVRARESVGLVFVQLTHFSLHGSGPLIIAIQFVEKVGMLYGVGKLDAKFILWGLFKLGEECRPE
jgi:hypothetical protein